jgi:hypothetical protein
MIEFLSINLLWWHWIILGLILVASEIFIPLFIVLWFGLSAVVVGLVDLGFETSFMSELFLWIVLSLIFLTLWFTFFKDKTITKSGQSDFTLDTKGVVIQKISPSNKGKVQFASPVLGDREWPASSDEIIETGESVQIVEIIGQLIKVKKDK